MQASKRRYIVAVSASIVNQSTLGVSTADAERDRHEDMAPMTGHLLGGHDAHQREEHQEHRKLEGEPEGDVVQEREVEIGLAPSRGLTFVPVISSPISQRNACGSVNHARNTPPPNRTIPEPMKGIAYFRSLLVEPGADEPPEVEQDERESEIERRCRWRS